MVLSSVACSVCVCVLLADRRMCVRTLWWYGVCVCVWVWCGSLAVLSAAHRGVLLICWSNRRQNTPGAVTLEGQDERRQCVLYSVVHGASAGRHPLITAAAFIWWPTAYLHTETKILQRADLFPRRGGGEHRGLVVPLCFWLRLHPQTDDI